MSYESGTYDEKLYRLFIDDKYSGSAYCRQNLGKGMEVIDQVIWGSTIQTVDLNEYVKS